MRNKAVGWKTSALPMPPVPPELLGGQQLARALGPILATVKYSQPLYILEVTPVLRNTARCALRDIC